MALPVFTVVFSFGEFRGTEVQHRKKRKVNNLENGKDDLLGLDDIIIVCLFLFAAPGECKMLADPGNEEPRDGP